MAVPEPTESGDGLDYGPLERAVGHNWYALDPELQWQVRRRFDDKGREAAEERLTEWGRLCGGPIARRAEIVDRHPPELRRYDRWGEEVNEVVHHPAARATKKDVWEKGPNAHRVRGDSLSPFLGRAFQYLLCQSDTGMACATGMTAGVDRLVDRFGSEALRERVLPRTRAESFEDAWDGAMFMTEVEGGSDLGRAVKTRARRRDDRWVLDGSKWFCSNVDADAIVTLARPEDAPEGPRGLGLFLVLARREDGSPNGIRIKRLKDKLGTRSVPTAEVDFVEAEAYALSDPEATDADARGLNRMMQFVNASRAGVATMGWGIMRRAFLEAAIYASRRRTYGRVLHEHPMVRETLVDMATDLGAAASLMFELADVRDRGREALWRILVPLAKYRLTRQGVSFARRSLELHGGNGYIENWPVARQLRDAQCHTIWEGAENIICLDVLRAWRTKSVRDAFWNRVERVLEGSSEDFLGVARDDLAARRDHLRERSSFLRNAPDELRELHARRFTRGLVRIVQGALLLEDGERQLVSSGSARRAAVARLFARRHLGPAEGRGIDGDRAVLDGYRAIVHYAPLEPSDWPG